MQITTSGFYKFIFLILEQFKLFGRLPDAGTSGTVKFDENLKHRRNILYTVHESSDKNRFFFPVRSGFWRARVECFVFPRDQNYCFRHCFRFVLNFSLVRCSVQNESPRPPRQNRKRSGKPRVGRHTKKKVFETRGGRWPFKEHRENRLRARRPEDRQRSDLAI